MYKYAILVLAVVFGLALTQTTISPQHQCKICDHIINQARHHFKNNITDENALKDQLLKECGHISNQGDQAFCKSIVNNNMDKIFADLQAGDKGKQTCEDLGYCQKANLGNILKGRKNAPFKKHFNRHI